MDEWVREDQLVADTAEPPEVDADGKCVPTPVPVDSLFLFIFYYLTFLSIAYSYLIATQIYLFMMRVVSVMMPVTVAIT
jgi:hypothetical protein